MSGYLTNKPDAGDTGTPFAQSIRDNFWAVWHSFATLGCAPGYDGDHNNSPASAPTIYYLKEQSAIATASGRSSGTRIFYRVTLTFTGVQVTKMQVDYSSNSGSSYTALALDAAGNTSITFDYTGRTVPFWSWTP